MPPLTRVGAESAPPRAYLLQENCSDPFLGLKGGAAGAGVGLLELRLALDAALGAWVGAKAGEADVLPAADADAR